MPYEYLDDEVTADITFRAWGADLAELFAAVVDAAASTMIEPLDAIRPLTVKGVEVEAEGLDILLLRFLDEVIFLKDAEGLILRAGPVSIEHTGAGCYRLAGELVGEPIDPEHHQRLGDVKAVTLAGLRVEPTADGWLAQVTLDV